MRVCLENVTKSFYNKKNKQTITAIKNLTLDLPDGKLIGLLGPSGCGKSTTLSIISGLTTPTSGKVYFNDNDVTNIPPDKRGIGLVFQNYALYPHMSVLENIIFPLINKKWELKKAIEKARKIAEIVQIEDFLNRKPRELSGGQQQRVAIARALVKSPDVLLLDEPLSNLDARLRIKTREEIKRIQLETNVTTIFVTHDQEEAMSICNIIVVMKDGKIQQIGKPQTIYEDPDNLFVSQFLGTPPINVFNGYIKGKKLYIGQEKIMDVEFEDQNVFVGIRPEGFIVDPNGVLTMNIDHLEVLGRDIAIVSKHPNSLKKFLRQLVDPKTEINDNKTIKYSINPNKIFIFKEDESRLR